MSQPSADLLTNSLFLLVTASKYQQTPPPQGADAPQDPCAATPLPPRPPYSPSPPAPQDPLIPSGRPAPHQVPLPPRSP